jgi:aspartyl/asparaginyl-tRNA synthetase
LFCDESNFKEFVDIEEIGAVEEGGGGLGLRLRLR